MATAFLYYFYHLLSEAYYFSVCHCYDDLYIIWHSNYYLYSLTYTKIVVDIFQKNKKKKAMYWNVFYIFLIGKQLFSTICLYAISWICKLRLYNASYHGHHELHFYFWPNHCVSLAQTSDMVLYFLCIYYIF